MNMNLITQLKKNKLVKGLSKTSFENIKFNCEAYQIGKQIKTFFLKKISFLL